MITKIDKYEHSFEAVRQPSGHTYVVMRFSAGNINLSSFIFTDANKLQVIDGRVEDIRRVIDGEIDLWEGGGDATYWSFRRDVSEIWNYFHDIEGEDEGPSLLVPTRRLEELILIWLREKAEFDRLHPVPGPYGWFRRWQNRRAERRQRKGEL